MLAQLRRSHLSTYKRFVRPGKEAERDGAYRVARRLQAVVRSSEGQSSGEFARILKAPRSKASEWLQRDRTERVDGLKDAEVWSWFEANRHWLRVHPLPPYSPELNPTERLWQHIRRTGAHNRFFAGADALTATLTRVFGEMQSHPQSIRSYPAPSC